MKNYELTKLMKMDKEEKMILQDISLEESIQLMNILNNVSLLDYKYNSENNTFEINRYQSLSKIFINQNDLLVLITNSYLSGNDKENLFIKEIDIKNRIQDKLVYLVDINKISKKEVLYELVKLYLNNEVVLNDIYEELNKDKDERFNIEIFSVYRNCIQLSEYLLNPHDNFIITEELISFIEIINIKETMKNEFKDLENYNKLESLNETISDLV